MWAVTCRSQYENKEEDAQAIPCVLAANNEPSEPTDKGMKANIHCCVLLKMWKVSVSFLTTRSK